MSDIIRLLPDSVANQIAAGEVVQRPASAVKELLENAIDAGASDIQLIIKDAGKTLIQIVDNGVGMSEADARLSFERHATSKIREADDLFAIRTMGFRGEALASIASIAQVEMKTRREEDELGTRILIEGSEVKAQEPCQTNKGTSIAVKNLFFNVPARRQFLKSDAVEMKHITEEFFRVALIHPQIKFSLFHNDKPDYVVEPSNFKQRIIALFGQNYKQRLVAVEQAVSHVKISGYIGKPEYAMKTKGEQYFFVNNRFIKHPYLNHAVSQAFQELISEKSYPSYFIHFEIEPKNIDINIHPTKTEVKFLDEKLIYGVLLAAVRKAIGTFNLAPSIDFSTNPDYQVDIMPKDFVPKMPSIQINPDYNPFERSAPKEKTFSQSHTNTQKEAYFDSFELVHSPANVQQTISHSIDEDVRVYSSFQHQNKYLIANTISGILLVDQERAHQRILFEQAVENLEKQKVVSQHKLFPQTIDFSPSNAELILDIQDQLRTLGWDIECLGKLSFVINATPADVQESEVKDIILSILDNYKSDLMINRNDKKTSIACSMAKSMSIKKGKRLTAEEQIHLLEQLFQCRMPQLSPSGKPVYSILTEDEIHTRLN